MTKSEHSIRADDYCQPEDGVVDSARRLAAAILGALATHSRVLVDMVSVPGASSSFYNVVFSELAARLGPATVNQRVRLVGLGKTQEQIANRSRIAVLGS